MEKGATMQTRSPVKPFAHRQFKVKLRQHGPRECISLNIRCCRQAVPQFIPRINSKGT